MKIHSYQAPRNGYFGQNGVISDIFIFWIFLFRYCPKISFLPENPAEKSKKWKYQKFILVISRITYLASLVRVSSQTEVMVAS